MGTGAGPGGGADLRPSLGGHRAPAVALVRRTEARPGDGVAITPGAPPGRVSRARLPTADTAVAPPPPGTAGPPERRGGPRRGCPRAGPVRPPSAASGGAGLARPPWRGGRVVRGPVGRRRPICRGRAGPAPASPARPGPPAASGGASAS